MPAVEPLQREQSALRPTMNLTTGSPVSRAIYCTPAAVPTTPVAKAKLTRDTGSPETGPGGHHPTRRRAEAAAGRR